MWIVLYYPNTFFSQFFCKTFINGYTEETEEKNRTNWQECKEFSEVIEKIINLQGIIIEICGSWVWLTGNTYFHKKEIKEAKQQKKIARQMKKINNKK